MAHAKRLEAFKFHNDADLFLAVAIMASVANPTTNAAAGQRLDLKCTEASAGRGDGALLLGSKPDIAFLRKWIATRSTAPCRVSLYGRGATAIQEETYHQLGNVVPGRKQERARNLWVGKEGLWRPGPVAQ